MNISFKNLKIKNKISVAIAIIELITALGIGIFCYIRSREALMEASVSHLVSVRVERKRNIENYFHQIHDQAISYSQNLMVVEAMRQFTESFLGMETEAQLNKTTNKETVKQFYQNSFLPLYVQKNKNTGANSSKFMADDPLTNYFQKVYIAENKHPIGSKDKLNSVNSDLAYHQHHAKYHPVFKTFLEKFGFYDLFLIDAKTGHIVYSVFKEADYGTNLLHGPYKGSSLATAFKAIRNSSYRNDFSLTDFEQYTPSYEAPASFMASPIFDGHNIIGVLVLQIPIDRIDAIMTGEKGWEQDGLGKSGETYLLGSDYKMKSNSRFLIEDMEKYLATLEKHGHDQAIIDKIRHNKTSILFKEINTEASRAAINGQTGTQIIKDYRNVSVLSSYAPVDILGLKWVILAEIDEAEAFAAVYQLRVVILIATVLVLILALIVSNYIAGIISKPMEQLTQNLKILASGDLTVQVRSQSKDETGMATESLMLMADNLNKVMSKILQASSQIKMSSQELSNASQQLSTGNNQQASATEEVASTMEEMQSNIEQNVKHAQNTELMTKEVTQNVNLGNQAVRDTLVAMQKITEKVKIIQEIARQTNMLALNAAVEAARAGDSGRGFAVVAAEVRSLAERSQQSAAEISNLGTESLLVAEKSGAILNEIVPSMTKTLTLVEGISEASAQQSQASEQINSSIQQLNEVVQENASMAEEMASNSEELSAQAESLQEQILFFKLRK